MAERVIQGRPEREYGARQQTEQAIQQAPLPQAGGPEVPQLPQNVTRPSGEPQPPKSMVSLFTPNQLFGAQLPIQSPNQHRRNVGRLWSALATDPEAPPIIKLVAERLMGKDRYAS